MFFQSEQWKLETKFWECVKKGGDEWANDVQARILHVHDLHAADAVYHKPCSVNFRTMKQIPANPKCGISRMSRSN